MVLPLAVAPPVALSAPPQPASPIRRPSRVASVETEGTDTPEWLRSARSAQSRMTSSSEEVTRLIFNGSVVERIHGVLCPSVLEHLALQQGVHLLTVSGQKYPVTRSTGKKIRIGPYTVSPESYKSGGAYAVLEKHSGMAPLRDRAGPIANVGGVSRMHRARLGAAQRR